jgi:phosphomannomutase
MLINFSIFKAYDIRGIYKKDFDEQLAYNLGFAYVELKKKDIKKIKLNRKFKIVVGADMRLSSPIIKKYLIKGLSDAGADVIDIGIVSTPTFYFAVANYKYDGGIMVSASHNPKEWNGFKLVRSKGVPISGDTGIQFLQEQINNKNIPVKNKGRIIKKKNILKEEIKFSLKHGQIKKIKPLKIVTDTANGVGILYINELFKKLLTKIIKINAKLDGSFPAHEADPIKDENLQQLKQEVIKRKADLGISTDGDGDRIFFIDNKGELIDQAIIRGLLAKLFLLEKPKSKIGFDVRPGKITEDLIKENGGKAIKTRVGHSLIKEQMLKENIYFSGECSGHFYVNMPIGCFEMPSIIILKLLQEFSSKHIPISEQIAPYKKYFHSGEINREVKNKEKIFKLLEKKYKTGKINKLDGITVEYKDFWFNVRGSNTENKMRLNLEAIDKKIMEKKRDEVLKLIF